MSHTVSESLLRHPVEESDSEDLYDKVETEEGYAGMHVRAIADNCREEIFKDCHLQKAKLEGESNEK